MKKDENNILSKFKNFLFPIQKDKVSLKFFLIFFLSGFVLLYFLLSAAIVIPYAHHDQIRYFTKKYNPLFKNEIGNDPQAPWQYALGRPVSAKVENFLFHHIHSLTDLARIRLIILVVLGLSMALLASFLFSLRLSPLQSFCISAAIFLLPGPQNIVFTTILPNALAILFALLSYLLLRLCEGMTIAKYVLRLLLSFILLLTAMFTYAAYAFFFLIPTIAVVMFSDRAQWSNVKRIVFRDLLFVALAAGAYFIFTKLYILPQYTAIINSTAPQYHFQFSLATLWEKINIFLIKVIPIVFNLWNVYENQFIAVVLILFSLGAFFVKAFDDDGSFKNTSGNSFYFTAQKLVVIFILFLGVNCVWLLSPMMIILYRLFFGASAAAILLIFWAGNSYIISFLKNQRWRERILTGWAVFFLVVSGGIAGFNTTKNVLNSNMELMFVRSVIASHAGKPISRIHVVLPVENNLGYNGFPSLDDNLNRKTTEFSADIADYLRLAIMNVADIKRATFFPCEVNQWVCTKVCPPDQILITKSANGSPIYPSPNMVLIDMNQLIRATGTSVR